MLTQIENAKQKWGGAHEAIDNWLHERQQLLVQYCELAGLPPFERESGALPHKRDIRSFCELLVDYVSAGHFEVYDKIVAGCDEPKTSKEITEDLYPKISATTDSALDFNDTYAEVAVDQDLASFDVNLSELGQKLEERFALEDRLIHSLHTEHL